MINSIKNLKILSKTLQTEKNVQNVYQRVNPSLYPKSLEKKNFIKNKAFLKNLYFKYLKIPIDFLKNKTMLEFGSGTGEFSVNYLLWDMKADFIELNPLAIKKFKNYVKNFSKSKIYKIYNKSIFTYKSKKKYDFVSSIGVIHHTNYKEAFKIKSDFVKKNGFMVLGIGNAAGMFQRNLQRYIIYFLSKKDEKKMYRLTKYLFPEFLKRAQKYGRRTLDSIIYDNIINPKDNHPSTKEILALAKKNNLSLYSSWPAVIPTFLSNSAQSHEVIFKNYDNILSINDFFSLVHTRDDQIKINSVNAKISKNISILNRTTFLINNLGSKKLPSLKIVKEAFKGLKKSDLGKIKFLDDYTNLNFINFQKEILILTSLLNEGNEKKLKSFIKKTKVLFKGNSGIGMNYYIFHKQ